MILVSQEEGKTRSRTMFLLDNYRLKAVFVVELCSDFKGQNHGEQSVYPSVKWESLKAIVDFTSAAQAWMSFFKQYI